MMTTTAVTIAVRDAREPMYYAVRVSARLVPGYSSADHLMDLAVDLSPLDGQAFDAMADARRAIRRCRRATVTTSGGSRFSAPRIDIDITMSMGWGSPESILQSARADALGIGWRAPITI